jgi:NAD(P)-dependent dehydrogenase (short-subunit alcohol dehydrogenase family)
MPGLADFALDGMTVAVTGAGRGIGRAIAVDLAAAGANVAACSRNQSELESLADEIASAGGRCAVTAVDISVRRGAREFVGFVTSTFGRIDGMVNNAGVNILKDAVDYTEDEVDLLIDMNLKAVYWSCIESARPMIDAGSGGAIVNITSQAGVVGAPGRAPYSGAKAGVNNMTRSLAAEWAAHGIRVNALAPTVTMTPLLRTVIAQRPAFAEEIKQRVLLGRPAEVREMSLPTVFLLSPAAAMITGQTLVVDGGWTIV